MSYTNTITNTISTKLNNPILKTLKEIKIVSLLKKSSFSKKDGASNYIIFLHFIYMILMNNAYFTLFFHPFHSKPSTFLSLKQACKIVA